MPYGTKSRETILRFSEEIFNFLMEFDAKLILIACNSASAYALEHLQAKSKIPVLGVIEPGIDALVKNYNNSNKAALIATPATVDSHAYEKALKRKNAKISLVSKPCPLFVPLVEEGLLHSTITKYAIKHYLETFKEKKHSEYNSGMYPLPSPKD